ncbi:sialidase-4-like [Discoglossus pictus]
MGSRHVPARTVLFEREKNGVTYRVPALLYVPRWSTLLAFAEERLSADDAHANLLVLRRGTFYRNYVEWEDMHAVEKAHLPGHRSMNPCPIYDEFTGELFLFFIAVLGRTTESYQIITGHNLTRLCYVTSTDQGRSWSDVIDLTHEVIGESLKDWATFTLGPGHGLQLKYCRFLIPAYTYHINCRDCFGKICRTTPKAFAFRSDDHGKSWMLGELIPNLQTVQCQLVSVDAEDGTRILYCNARSSLGFRVQALSSDDGVLFEPGQVIEKLQETASGCHGSVIGFPAPFGFLSRIHANDALNGETKHCKVLPKVSEIVSQCRKILQVQQKLNQYDKNVHKCESKTNKIANSVPHKQMPCVKGSCECSYNGLMLSESSSLVGLEKQKKRSETLYRTKLSLQPPTWVLYSHPTNSISRVNLGVYLSPYPRWVGPWVIYDGPSAYSDLAYLELPSCEVGVRESPPVIAFACLYENGISSPYEQISFSIFTLYEVIQSLPPNPNILHEMQSKGKMKGRCKTS